MSARHDGIVDVDVDAGSSGPVDTTTGTVVAGPVVGTRRVVGSGRDVGAAGAVAEVVAVGAVVAVGVVEATTLGIVIGSVDRVHAETTAAASANGMMCRRITPKPVG